MVFQDVRSRTVTQLCNDSFTFVFTPFFAFSLSLSLTHTPVQSLSVEKGIPTLSLPLSLLRLPRSQSFLVYIQFPILNWHFLSEWSKRARTHIIENQNKSKYPRHFKSVDDREIEYLGRENTYSWGSITVLLTSCLFCLDSTAMLLLN